VESSAQLDHNLEKQVCDSCSEHTHTLILFGGCSPEFGFHCESTLRCSLSPPPDRRLTQRRTCAQALLDYEAQLVPVIDRNFLALRQDTAKHCRVRLPASPTVTIDQSPGTASALRMTEYGPSRGPLHALCARAPLRSHVPGRGHMVCAMLAGRGTRFERR